MNLDDVAAATALLVIVCLIFAVWIAFTERGKDTDDWFRKRWTGSDAKYVQHDQEADD